MEKVIFGGQERPISCGMRLRYLFETQHQVPFLPELAKVAFLNSVEVDKAEGLTPWKTLADIVHCALQAGAEQDGRAVDFTVLDVLDWIDEDKGYKTLFVVVEKIKSSFFSDEKTEDTKKKKPSQKSPN